MDTEDDIDLQLKELERDKRLEEIRLLRANAKTRWITPTALAALLPLFAGVCVWSVGELKLYNAGYKALAELDALKREKEALQQEKVNLNIEVSTILQLKTHYASESQRLQHDTSVKQEAIDRNYLRGLFTSGEALYALDHIKGMGPPPDRTTLMRLKEEIKQFPKETAAALDNVLNRYEMSLQVISISRDVISEFDTTLKLMPSSDWTRELQNMPTGAVVQNKKIMILKKEGDVQKYYDVVEGRFLTQEEAGNVR